MISKKVDALTKTRNLFSLQAAKAWSRKSKGGEAESEISSSSKEPVVVATPSRNSTGLMSWLKLNKEGPPEHQGVRLDNVAAFILEM